MQFWHHSIREVNMFQPAQFRSKIIPDFYPRAKELRRRYEDFFATPHLDTAANFCLNLWHVKDNYNYVRAYPHAILGHELYNDFTAHLSKYVRDEFGLQLSGAYLSIYCNSMYQSIHSDQMNGTYGFTFSLTRWTERKFTGGETMIARENVFDQLEPRGHKGHTSYMEPFPQHFNQLTLFDDRIAHAINPVHGTMDPLEARISIHGHVY